MSVVPIAFLRRVLWHFARLRRFNEAGLAVGLSILLALTIYYITELPGQDWRALLAGWRAEWRTALLALGISIAGTAMDFLAWVFAWRGQRMHVPLRLGIPLYFSSYALQVIPMQLGRLAHIALMFRSGLANLRCAITAETMLFGLDLTAMVCLLGTILLPYPYKYAGIAATVCAGPFVLYLCDRFRDALGARFKHLSDCPFFSFYNAGAYYSRMLDWVCLGTLLYFMTRVTGPGAPWDTAAATVLGASLIGGASALPGGLGVNEAVLTFGLQTDAPDAGLLGHGAAVFGHRLVTFWMWIPVGWWGLLRFRRLALTPRRISHMHAPETGAPGTPI